MMPARVQDSRLIERLPKVRGRLTENAPLAPITWFRVGGPAEVMFRPADRNDLAEFLAHKPSDVPVTILGVGSNLLVRDGGIPGVVIRLGRDFAGIDVSGTTVTAGAAALDLNVARAACEADVGGLEFLSGIPGTIGGALRMNAGAYGSEMKDIVIAAEALDATGKNHRIVGADLGFANRQSSVPDDWMFTSAVLEGRRSDRATVERAMAEIARAREESQPVRTRTGGSTFKNPPNHSAWQLIDKAGCRGLRVGGAAVSEMHCNFLLNTGTATASDIEALGEEIRRRVLETTGVPLDWEIRRVGIEAPSAKGPR